MPGEQQSGRMAQSNPSPLHLHPQKGKLCVWLWGSASCRHTANPHCSGSTHWQFLPPPLHSRNQTHYANKTARDTRRRRLQEQLQTVRLRLCLLFS